MVTLELYSNKAENIVVDKTNYISIFKTIRGVFRESTSLINPSIQIAITSSDYLKVYANETQVKDNQGVDIITIADIPALFKCNYVYINEFGRYYYITDIICIRNNLYELQCKVDVLMSHKAKILALKQCLIERNQYNYNKFLNDDNYQTDSLVDIEYIEPWYDSGALDLKKDISIGGGVDNNILITVAGNEGIA